MDVISHRGYWKTANEKNVVEAFIRSFELGFGTETDVRDLNGALVISHDMPVQGAMSLTEFLALDRGLLPLAINIKSDGLAVPIRDAMVGVDRNAWFVFDMSIPDMRIHIKVGNPVFTRMSEYEQDPLWLDQSEGIWLDHFEREWFDTQLLASLLDTGKRVCVVSSELHGRDHLSLWRLLRPLIDCKNLMLCTDMPERAKSYFGSVNQ